MIEIRPLTKHSEFFDAVQMQRLIWNWQDLDLIPVRFFVVAREIGGQLLGAFDGGSMVGFLMAVPGVTRHGETYLHSHMLGVMPEYRNAGAGRMLKIAQKNDALSRGIDLVEWTFDPLELKNAYFNLQRLGAVVRAYKPNHYGMTSSVLQAGLPTDRCVAEWHLRVPRFEGDIVTRIPVPIEINEIKRTDPARAKEIQTRVRERFEECFASGLIAVGFEKTEGHGNYLLANCKASES
ncbi:MAG: GNAT family N-acetyltransferase [Bryobacteraceae bacterium]